MPIKRFILLFFLFGMVSHSVAEETYPYMARVEGSKLNVRAGAGLDFAVLTQLKKGDILTAVGEKEEWLQVEPPKGTTFWIYSRMLRDGWPKKDQVNVRSGPGTHFTVVCQVDQNTSLDILAIRDGWTQINPPENARVWIYKDYVQFFSTPEDFLVKLEEEKRSKELFEEAESFRRSELNKEMDEIDFDQILIQYQTILDLYPKSAWSVRCQARLTDVNRKKKVAQRELRTRQKWAEKKQASSRKRTIRIEKKKEEVLLSFEGRLRLVKGKNKLFTHQLYGGGFWNRRPICLISSPELKLKTYLGKKIRVWGKFVATDNEQLSGIQVERVKPVP